MSRYIEIVHPEDIDRSGGFALIDGDEATRYEPLERVEYPANNGHGDWTETVMLVYTDGTTEKVRGHVTGSGEVEA
jgi:hypothetical protein